MIANVQKLRGDGATRVFYFPYAGGSASSFHYIDNHLGPAFQSYGIDPPGHGAHSGPYLKDYQSFFQACADAVLHHLTRPYVLVGYSLGGLVVHDLIQLLQDSGRTLPDFTLIGGCLPPHLVSKAFRIKGWHQMSDQEIYKDLFEGYDIPSELRENPEYLQLLLPLYRADSQVFHSYSHRRSGPIKARIQVFGGRDDKDIPLEDLMEWSGIGLDVKVDVLPGGHMFLRESGKIMAEAIREKMGIRRPFPIHSEYPRPGMTKSFLKENKNGT